MASHQISDEALSCGEIQRQIDQVKEIQSDIEHKRGISGRNVGMALFFWPGVLVNEYNGSEAMTMAQKRQDVLVQLYHKKHCGGK